MIKNLVYIIILISFVGCYKDKDEVIRNSNPTTSGSGSGLAFDSIPCQNSLILNTAQLSFSRILNFSTPYGSIGGKYVYGYKVFTSAPLLGNNYDFRLEFKEKPTGNTIYYAANDNTNFLNSFCFFYITVDNPTREFFATPGTKIYVDTSGNGLTFNYCGGRLTNNTYGQYIDLESFNITTTN